MNIQVIVLVAGNERGGAASHIVTLAEVVRAMDATDNYTFAVVGEGPLYARLQALAVRTHLLPAQAMKTVGALRSLIRQERMGPMVLHAHGPRMNLMAYLAARGVNTSWMSTVHSNLFKDFLSSRWKTLVLTRLNYWCLRRSTGLFVVHPDFGRWFPGQAVFHVPNGINMTPLGEPVAVYRERLRSRLGLSDSTPLLGIAARFDPVKDISTIIRALSRMHRTDAHFVVAGEGEERAKLEALTAELGLQGRVHFLGFLDHVREFYAALDIHVLASLSEGTPFSILEAGYFSVPNVGTDIPGITQLISDGRTGRCFPVGDADALAAIADDVLTHGNEARQLADAFISEVLPQYTPTKMYEAYRRGYETAIGI